MQERRADAPTHEPAPIIPEHELLRFIGSGAYGEIWLARNMTGQLRAVKVVHRKRFDTAKALDREFHGMSVFEPISRQHDGFVDILHIGRNDERGYFYYLMELADDAATGTEFEVGNYTPRTLRSEMDRRGQLPADDCVGIGLSLTGALHFLHQHGLIHRDIKPANVIFVHGTPKLADIGLVAAAGQRSFVGTEGFVPPEGPGSQQADIYSLGKVLYEMSMGKDRFDFPELPTNLDQHGDGARLRQLNSVLLKACANDPTARYQTARAMHDDLLHLGRPRPVVASGSSLWKKWAALVLLLLLAGGAWFLLRRGGVHSLPGAASGELSVTTIPGGASATLGEDEKKRTPAVFEGIRPGEHPLEIRLDGYDRLTRTVTIRAGERIDLPPLKLRRSTGSATLTSTPGGALFQIENPGYGTRGGRTPATLTGLPTGDFTVRFNRVGWPPHVQTITIAAGETAAVHWDFKNEDRLPRPEPGQPWVNSLGMKFVPVPGIEGLMGVTETRIRDFAAFVEATGYDATGWMTTITASGPSVTGATWREPGFAQGPDHPVVGVSWKDAIAFCQWLTEKERRAGLLRDRQSYLLPTDAEWSRSAGLGEEPGATPAEHSGVVKGFPWGETWPPPADAGNYAGEEMRDVQWPANWKVLTGRRDHYGRTAPVGSFPATALGLHDIGGNVWEWCFDKYGRSGDSRVVRGAAWCNVDPDLLLTSCRIPAEPDVRNDSYGFRVLVEAFAAGSVTLSTEPRGATVVSEGTEIGETPLELHDIRAGEVAYTVRLRGHKTATIRGVVEPNQQIELTAKLTAVPGPQAGTPWTNSLGMKFVPVEEVLFSIWETRVRDYAAFCEATDAPMPDPGFTQTPDHPVARVSWRDAETFCQWLTAKERREELLQNGETYRLPTDAEWSRAVGLPEEPGDTPEARDGRIKGVYPWGEKWPPPGDAGNYADEGFGGKKRAGITGHDDGFPTTAPVGSFPANALGLYDLGGNVWEWIQEPYRVTTRVRDWGVLRGGSWANDSPPALLSSYRNVVSREDADPLYGFRVVLDPR